MSSHAMPHPDRSPKPRSGHQAEGGNGEARTLGVGSSNTPNQSKVTKPRWTARRTHAQFSLYYFPFTSRRERQEQRDAQAAAMSMGKVAEPLENAVTSSSAVTTSEKPQAATAGRQTAVESEPVQSPERLQTNGEQQPLPDPVSSNSATNLTMNDQAMSDTKLFDAEAAAVPRTFDYTDLTFSSDESDKEAPVQSPNFTAKAPPVHDGPSSFPGAQALTAASAYGLAPPTTKAEPASTPRRPRTEVQVMNNGENREYIYIDSSDESDEGDDDTSSPIRRLTLEESSFDMPAMEVPAASVEDVVSPKMTEDDPFAEYQPPSYDDEPMGDVFEPSSPEEMARTENTSSEDSIPLAILRKNLSPTVVNPARNENETSEDDIPLAILRKNGSAATVEPTRNETETSEDDIPLAMLRKNLSPALVRSTRNEKETSEDNVPIAFLRTNRSRSKRHLSDDEGDEEAEISIAQAL
ncbi:hypothetical protein NLG97_g7568 [Lecanicillium saksenae]|uniref:Uncharacterized protein n=1 Tax=Lecanicillium saksenae TaxID=468837 RepID=A0ACC1QLF2_9HYPO|nr:hypothetical protein NLG97_g7568 [Lecanicillium saksenae]